MSKTYFIVPESPAESTVFGGFSGKAQNLTDADLANPEISADTHVRFKVDELWQACSDSLVNIKDPDGIILKKESLVAPNLDQDSDSFDLFQLNVFLNKMKCWSDSFDRLLEEQPNQQGMAAQTLRYQKNMAINGCVHAIKQILTSNERLTDVAQELRALNFTKNNFYEPITSITPVQLQLTDEAIKSLSGQLLVNNEIFNSEDFEYCETDAENDIAMFTVKDQSNALAWQNEITFVTTGKDFFKNDDYLEDQQPNRARMG